jgi:hypothetical protein
MGVSLSMIVIWVSRWGQASVYEGRGPSRSDFTTSGHGIWWRGVKEYPCEMELFLHKTRAPKAVDILTLAAEAGLADEVFHTPVETFQCHWHHPIGKNL